MHVITTLLTAQRGDPRGNTFSSLIMQVSVSNTHNYTDTLCSGTTRPTYKTTKCPQRLESGFFFIFGHATTNLHCLQMPPLPLYFHTCMYYADLPMTLGLVDLLFTSFGPVLFVLFVVAPRRYICSFIYLLHN